MTIPNQLKSIVEAYQNMSDEKNYFVFEITDEDIANTDQEIEFEYIAEGEAAGNLKDLTKHLIKVATQSGKLKAGQNSEVTSSGPVKNMSALRGHVAKALEDGHMPIVHVNGKPVSAAVAKDYTYGSRPEYHVHNPDSQHMMKGYEPPKAMRGYTKPARYYDEPTHTKGEALTHVIPDSLKGDDAKDAFKKNSVEVKVVHKDLVRQKMHAAREANKPAMQDNYKKAITPAEKAKAYGYSGRHIKTSSTPKGDELKGIKQAAAEKLAAKKVPESSANADVMKLHTELGEHIKAGRHKEARNTASKISDQIYQKGLSSATDNRKEYAENLGKLKSSWNKEYAKKRLAQLRGEKNEAVTEDDLELLIEMFDDMDTEDQVILEAYLIEETEVQPIVEAVSPKKLDLTSAIRSMLNR